MFEIKKENITPPWHDFKKAKRCFDLRNFLSPKSFFCFFEKGKKWGGKNTPEYGKSKQNGKGESLRQVFSYVSIPFDGEVGKGERSRWVCNDPIGLNVGGRGHVPTTPTEE